MNTKEKILHHINPDGWGVEIGPSYNPKAPKKEGYNVHIIDHLNQEELLEKYKDSGVSIENIEDVDFIWHGESYADLTGKRKFYDWIIASHVIEHTPDFIGFLLNCEEILKDDGVISLVVPDKRFCFDHYRPLTGISKIIDSHLQKNKVHTPGSVVEHFYNHVLKDERTAWGVGAPGDYRLVHSLDEVKNIMNWALDEDQPYIDTHAWCFVPHSFRLLIHDLFCLGFISLKEVDFFQTENFEFFVTLGRNGSSINKSRLEMLKEIEAEINI